jgi:hypothetical protein
LKQSRSSRLCGERDSRFSVEATSNDHALDRGLDGAADRAVGGEAEPKVYPGIGHLDRLTAAPWPPSLAPVADDIAGFVVRHTPP